MISQIGKYTIEAELGFGGFGRVYKAWDPDVRQSVAIKVLLAEGDPELLKRFQQEVVTTASLHHKNIVTIYASGEEAGTPYLVMELLEGQTLGQIIKQRIALSLVDKVRIMTQVAEGLAYAHSRGIVHRDIKPANIMLQPDGSAKIMDFGIALASNRRTMNMTMDGFVLGTVPYMAPEQFTSDCKASEQTDIFSFGDVYYELLTGQHPFAQFMRDMSSLHIAILTHDPQPVSQISPECPEALELVVHRTLAKEREFRYQTFEELRLDSASVLVDLQHEQAAAILREVPRLLAIADLPEARAKVREAQTLDPGNRQARQLLETIDQQLQEKANRQRIAARMTEAEKHLSERRFTEAVQLLETAAKLDSTNLAVRMRLADAKAKLGGAVEANRLLEDARSRQQRGGLTEALERLDRAIQIDPEHTAARRLHAKVAEQVSRQRRDQIRQQALQAASDHAAAKNFVDALAILDELEKEQPGEPAVADLRLDIERQRAEEERRIRADRFHRALTKTRDTMQAGDLDRAAQMLVHLNSNFSAEPGVAEILLPLRDRLDALLRAREISTCRQQANDLLKQKAFREASQLLADALSRYPEDPGLVRQKASADALFEAHKRSEAVAAVLNRTNTLRDSGDLRGALAAIADARKRLGDEAALVDFEQQLAMEFEQQRYAAGLDDLLAKARALMAAGQYAEAIDEIARAQEYGQNTEVRALLDSAHAAADDQQEQQFVAGALANAASLRAQQDWDGALNTVADARLRYPRNLALAQALEQLRDEAAREQRRAALQQHRAAILREIEACAWKQAEAAVRQAREEIPDDSALHQLDQRIQAGLREEALQEAATIIRAKLAANNLPEAMRHLDQTRSVFIRDPRWKAIEEEVELRRAYEAAIEEAERHQRAGDAAKAVPLLTGIIKSAPDARATEMLQAIERRRAEVEAVQRQAAIAAVAEGVRGSLKRDDFRQAAAELNAARAKYAGEALWDTLRAEIDSQQAAQKQIAMLAAAESVRECLKRADLRQAAADLNAARAKYPGESVWAKLQTEIDQAEAIGKRQEAIAAIADGVRNCLKRDDLRQATAELDAAVKKYRGEALWDTLRAEIGAQQAAQRGRAIGAAADSVRECLNRDDLDQAIDLLRKARKSFPGEPAWADFEQEIHARQEVPRHQSQLSAVTESLRETPPQAAPALTPPGKSIPWKVGLLGAAAMVSAALLAPRLLRKPNVPPPPIPFEIRTDPPGATIHLGARACETPNCRFELPPGSYHVEAALKDYAPKTETVVVDASRHLLELTLEPLPPPTKPDQPAASSGTLLVQTGVSDVLVYVDGRARSRTDRSGSLKLPLDATAHEVRVERNGYESPVPRKVTIADGSQQSVVFSLTPRTARLELHGAPAGVEIRVSGKSLGTTNGSSTFLFPSAVTPGDQPLQVTLGSGSRSIQQRFEPGQTLRIEWKDVMPAAALPTAPTAEMLERQQWERIRTTSDIDQLRGFLRSYPGSAHAKEAESRVSDLLWSAIDQNNLEAVRRFVKDNPDNPHRQDGQRIVDQLEERARTEQAKLDVAKKQELAKQETSARQDQLRKHQVFETLSKLDTAMQKKRVRDIKALWPEAPAKFLEGVGTSGARMSLNTREEDVRFPQGPDEATVQGNLTITVNGNTSKQKATLILRNSGGAWIVSTATFN